MKLNLRVLMWIVVLLFLGCNTDTPPEENSIIYPISYMIDGYDYEQPEYYLVLDNGLTQREGSSNFSNYVNGTLFEQELVNFSELFAYKSFTLTSDSTYDGVIYDHFAGEEINFSGVYDRTDTEIKFWNTFRTSAFPLNYDIQNDQLEWCEYGFTHTFWSANENTTRYANFDFIACHFLPSDDPLFEYTEQNSLMSTNDTLAVFRITRYYSMQ